MRRLVVATTALLVMVGAAVVASYLLLFSAVADRASRAVPADTALYLKVYLQPSTGQKMNLLSLVGRVPGFRDAATIEEKIHEVAQRLLAKAGIDYAGSVRPWLGNEVAMALSLPGAGGTPPHALLLAVVRDPEAAQAEVPRLMAANGATYTPEVRHGQRAMIGKRLSYALLDDLLLVADSADRLRAAIDANANSIPSLADSAAFEEAMRSLPADHLASLYLNVAGTPPGGYSTAALSLTAKPDGLHLDGNAPFASKSAGNDTRAAFALSSRPASLGAWMPRSTRVEVVVFGLQQNLADIERRMAAVASFADAVAALNQLRGVAAIGLGINLDRDLLSLFDGEAAVALPGIDRAAPRPLLLLRPGDPAAAAAALDRMRTGLVSRGSTLTTSRAAGAAITSVTVPQVGGVAYAQVDGIVLLALDPADVAAALEAHASGLALSTDNRYQAPFELTGRHAGNEFWADLPGLVDASGGIFDPGTELRDILHQIGVLAMSASGTGDQLQIHAVLTVK
jgi:Protein of unknown function (DUF3352)